MRVRWGSLCGLGMWGWWGARIAGASEWQWGREEAVLRRVRLDTGKSERVSRWGHAGGGGHLFEDKGENCSVFS